MSTLRYAIVGTAYERPLLENGLSGSIRLLGTSGTVVRLDQAHSECTKGYVSATRYLPAPERLLFLASLRQFFRAYERTFWRMLEREADYVMGNAEIQLARAGHLADQLL